MDKPNFMKQNDYLVPWLLVPFIVLTFPLWGVSSVCAQTEGSQERRSVIFILSDDHRYDFMGFHENAPEFLETPGMDRMAREGAHLANAFVTTSLCSPSRASILTGQYAHRHGVVDNQRLVPEGTRFFPQDLQEAGYETAFVGKWHMGGATDEPRPGFDHWVSFRGQGSYYDPTLNVNGERSEFEGYTADILTDHALNWLEEQEQKDEPFFMYLSHKSVHGPFRPAERHASTYGGTGFDRDMGSSGAEPVDVEYPATMYKDAPYRETWPDWVKEQRSSWHGVDYMYHGRLDFNNFYRRYAETLRGLDDSIREVISYLEESGLDEETLVIYMGDNGFSFGEHGLIDKRQAFEESMRVPMLAWAPGMIESGSRIERMVANIDVAPTVLDAANTEMPDEHVVDGQSFLPLLKGNNVGDWREAILYEYYWEWNYPQTPTQFAWRTDDWKYIFFYGVWDPNALFNLEEDPQEARNLLGEENVAERHRERARKMREAMFEKLAETNGMFIPLRAPRGGRNADTRPPGEPTTDPLADR